MKEFASLLLSVCLLMMLAIPVAAAEDCEGTIGGLDNNI